MPMTMGVAFGKLILFGEHFVVHGLPGIVAGIQAQTTATIQAAKKFELIDGRTGANVKIEEAALSKILAAMKLDAKKNPVKITMGGNLPIGQNLGSSATFCVSIVRALSQHFELNYTNEQVSTAALAGENYFHGLASGIDTTAATYGGILWFERGPPLHVQQIKIAKPLYLVIANSGVQHESTKQAVARVRGAKKKNPKYYNHIFAQEQTLVKEARTALEHGNLQKIGDLANENHKLLQKIHVSCSELDELVHIAQAAGAIGAKMTGGGRGGNMFAITNNKFSQKKIATALQERGYQTVTTRVY